MSELSELKRIGAIPTKNSGRGKHEKGDGRLDDIFTVDVKEYEKSFGLSQQTWGKICTDAITNRNEPALKVVIGGTARMMVVSETMFLEMYSAYKKVNGIE